MSFKVLGCGSPMMDLVVNVDDDFIARSVSGAKGGMELVDAAALDAVLAASGAEPAMAPGGSAANTIFGLARLGVSTAFLGMVGSDAVGASYRSRYEAMGGDAGLFKISSAAASGRCLSLVTPDSQRTMRTDLGAAALMGTEDVIPAEFAGFNHVHIEGYLLFNPDLAAAVLNAAKAAGATVSLDLASFEVVAAAGEGLSDMLRDFVDMVFANEDEAAAFAGGDPRSALKVLSGLCPVAVVKLGADGALIAADGEVVEVGVEPIRRLVDTTGAGDLWQAGFLYGYLSGGSLGFSGKCGAVLAAEVIQVMGAEISAAKWNTIINRIKSF